MILGIDPKIDLAFKYMVGRQSTEPITADMLNSVLQRPPGREIQEVELLNPYNLQDRLDDKLSVLDIKARDKSGELFNVEMQVREPPYYLQRVTYYWARLYQGQLHEGEDYGKLRPTISISFLGHVQFPKLPDYHLRFRLLETQHHVPMNEDVEFHILELPKFTKSLDQLKTGLDRWLYFLRFGEKIDTEGMPPALDSPMIHRAVKESQMLSQSDIERERYEARRKAELDYRSSVNFARGEGRTEGRAEGEKIGAIHTYQRLLQQPQTPTEQLLAMTQEELARLAADLEKQFLAAR